MSAVAEKSILERRLAELEDSIKTIESGLSKKEKRLRDEFAMAVLNGICSGDGWPTMIEFPHMSKMAYSMADAMIAERAKGIAA